MKDSSGRRLDSFRPLAAGMAGQRLHDILVDPVTPKLMTSPPTVKVDGPFSTNSGNSLIAGGAWINLATFLAGGYFNFIGATPGGTTSLTNNSQSIDAPPYQIEFHLSGQAVEFWNVWGSNAGNMRIRVDGEYVSLTPIMPSPSTNGANYTRTNITFAAPGNYRITLEMDRVGFIGFYREANGMVWPSQSKPDKAAFLGDSYTAGSVVTASGNIWANVCAKRLRWNNPYLLGQGGTGYLNPGTSGRATFANRIANITAIGPETLVIAGGYNDVPSKNAAYTSTALQTAAAALFASIATNCPTVKRLFVVGPWRPNSGTAQELIDANTAIKTAAQAAPNVTAYIDLTSSVTGNGWAGVPAPVWGPAPVVAASGGTFTAGTYYYKATSLTSRGESTASQEVSVTVAANGTVTFNWAPQTFATGYNIYRGTTSGGENVKVASNVAGPSWTDTGTAGTAATPPTTDTSGNANASGLAERVTGSDSVHPVDFGGQFWGAKVASAIAAYLEA